MIKRIQLRGISHSPSDRITEDGACDESLNLYIENNEIVSNPSPIDITEKIGIPINTNARLIFVHKTPSYTNYVVWYNGSLGVFQDSVFHGFINISYYQIKKICSIGNTLVLLSEQGMYYILYKDGDYSLLGNQIPTPHIEFNLTPIAEYIPTDSASSTRHKFSYLTKGTTNWANSLLWEKQEDQNIKNVVSQLYKLREELITENLKQGNFFAPMFIRYAVRLYDGSYVRHSVPILLGAGYRHFYDSYIRVLSSQIQYGVIINSSYNVTAKLSKFDLENWKDIISSVDFFISPMMKWPGENAKIVSLTNVENGLAYHIYNEKLSIDQEEKKIEEQLLSLGTFYKIASFPIEDFIKFIGEKIQFKQDEIKLFPYEENLVTQVPLVDDYRSNHLMSPSIAKTYNDRFLFSQVKTIIPSGYMFLNATRINDYGNRPDPHSSITYKYSFNFFVRSGDGQEAATMGLYTDNREEYVPYTTTVIGSGGQRENADQKVYGWITYPDPNCYKVIIRIDTYEGGEIFQGSGFSIEMKPHPKLQCSYAYFGISKDITLIRNEVIPPKKKKPVLFNYNKVYQSEVSNPFLFTPSGTHTVSSGSILGIETITTPLSTGQFGQFALYVFTTEGIWALQAKTDGTFYSAVPVSADVAISENMICQANQNIVFLTDKGVMLLSGSSVKCISEYLRGDSFIIDDSIRNVFKDTMWENYIKSLYLANSDTFKAYMDRAECSFDYEGNRIIFFNSEYEYIYLFMIDTGTWHKQILTIDSEKATAYAAVNSYPECYINTSTSHFTRVLNYSSKFNVDAKRDPGIIITRAFDLSAPDVKKIIKDIRIRGRWSKDHPKYILLGSNDGENFTIVKSLKASSWKHYKMIIATNLQRDESISWIDINYEERYRGKLR